MLNYLINLAERGWIPDWLIRQGIRQLLAQRIRCLTDQGELDQRKLIEQLSSDGLAVETEAANAQHYEVPAAFFQRVLGTRLKYSCALFESADSALDQAEEAMLELTCQRAGIEDGQNILELGCGWGSLTIWMAEHFPNSRITAISNSHSQRAHIEKELQSKQLHNATILTRDMRTFDCGQKFDRIVSVEMFEHMRNYRELFQRIAGWMQPHGRLFVHIFCHQHMTYLFETEGASNWMGRHFFTGGTMPAESLFSQFKDDLAIEQQWRVNGMHYWQTCESWLQRLDSNYSELHRLFAREMIPSQATVMLQRWRIFMMACAELFRYDDGNQWFVAHYLFSPTAGQKQSTQQISSPTCV